MKLDVYGKNDYVDVLREAIAKNGRGYKSRLAARAGCQPSYLSQVLSGTAELNADQAYPLCEFLSLNEFETEYFILLINRKRAATRSLKRYYTQRLETIAADQSSVSKRIGAKKQLETELREQYYSSWHHSAIHIATSIRPLSHVAPLAAALRLNESTVTASLKLLEEMALIERRQNRWHIVQNSIHIPSSSPLHIANHINWRLYFCQNIQNPGTTPIHYTAVHSLSKTDAENLRNMILNYIEETRNLVEPSKEECLVALGIDFLRLA